MASVKFPVLMIVMATMVESATVPPTPTTASSVDTTKPATATTSPATTSKTTGAATQTTSNPGTTAPAPTEQQISDPVVCNGVTCALYRVCDQNNSACVCAVSDTITDNKEVCGSDGETYKSFQHLKMMSCNSESNVKKVAYGKCEDVNSNDEKKSGTKTTIIVIVVVVLIVLICVVVGVLLMKRRKSKKREAVKDNSDNNLL